MKDAVEPVRQQSAREVAEAMTGDQLLLVDVREPAEWIAGHAAGAVHVPLGEIDHELPRLEREASGRDLAFICRSGSRSGKAATRAAASDDGPMIINVIGGTVAWQEADLPLVPADGSVLDPRKDS